MTVTITHDDQRLRVEWLKDWYFRAVALPFLLGSSYFLYYVGITLKGDLMGTRYLSEDWAGVLIFSGFALLIGLPGLILATLRYFIDVDPAAALLVVTKQFGPLKFRTQRKLGEFKFISITDHGDAETGFTAFHVALCGGRGTRPVMVSSFDTRAEAKTFADTLGAELKLRPKDYVGTEPDAY